MAPLSGQAMRLVLILPDFIFSAQLLPSVMGMLSKFPEILILWLSEFPAKLFPACFPWDFLLRIDSRERPWAVPVHFCLSL